MHTHTHSPAAAWLIDYTASLRVTSSTINVALFSVLDVLQSGIACRWLEHMLGETLPPVTELEDAFQNGVILCKLGMKLLPDDPAWRKVYDLDLEKFKVSCEYALYEIDC